MNITTKFNFGQEVWVIHRATKPLRNVCPICEGTSRITINEASFRCPNYSGGCNNGLVTTWIKEHWHTYQSGTVGSIRLNLYDSNANIHEHEDERSYMLCETGVGSGSVYCELNMFASEEEAQAECDRRNAEDQGDMP